MVLVARDILHDLHDAISTGELDLRELFLAGDKLQSVLDDNPPLTMSMFASSDDYSMAMMEQTRLTRLIDELERFAVSYSAPLSLTLFESAASLRIARARLASKEGAQAFSDAQEWERWPT